MATLLLLLPTHAQAHDVSSIVLELELMPSFQPSPPPPTQHGTSEHVLWTLYTPVWTVGQQGGGSLLDSAGKVAHDLLSFSSECLMLIQMCCSRCSRSRYYPLA